MKDLYHLKKRHTVYDIKGRKVKCFFWGREFSLKYLEVRSGELPKELLRHRKLPEKHLGLEEENCLKNFRGKVR